ncbi:hypothetical protein AB835_13600 [Candidatus Endobugula sertula]|uniref:Mangotoxin biosynthesis-involved protein MgoB n=1 Tax=Candidatus Endobugula sertula TaxID=62101 RepID=A0A1D2QLV0_9GAMM|nr:hypothetical protein AB835_13600 [Candidatus Endobugula sertula]
MNKELNVEFKKISKHPLYNNIKSLGDLRIFMSFHVFAVWDFMSLAKRLQRSLTCIELPWINPINSASARLINEIIFYEESDLNIDGSPASHVSMYLEAMEEVGADTTLFNSFIFAMAQGKKLKAALDVASVPNFVKKFVCNNIGVALNGLNEEVAANFLYGREDAIPEMFSQLLDQWGVSENRVPRMTYYLKRHIDLDGDEHGPAAHKILENLIGDCEHARKRAKNAAHKAIKDRVSLWDGILAQISENKNVKKIRLEKFDLSESLV